MSSKIPKLVVFDLGKLNEKEKVSRTEPYNNNKGWAGVVVEKYLTWHWTGTLNSEIGECVKETLYSL